MKAITYSRPWATGLISESLQAFVECEFTPSDHDSGVVEDLQHGASNIAKSFANLLELLHDKGVLDAREVYGVIHGFKSLKVVKDVTITEEKT